MVRIRDRVTKIHPPGTRRYLGNVYVRSAQPDQEHCEDVATNPGGNNPLTLEKFENFPSYYDGYSHADNYARKFPLEYFQTKRVAHLVHSGFRDATQAIASGHPGQPAVSIPNFTYELKDVPDMLKHAKSRALLLHKYWINRGKTVTHRKLKKYYSTRRAGEDWLNYQFGWLPFFSDLASIIDLDSWIRNRQKKYASIKKSQLQTTGTLGHSFKSSGPTGTTFNSFAGTSTGPRYSFSEQDKWYSATWEVDQIRFGEALNSGTLSTLKDALGLDKVVSINLWNALPWTWFIDWFANVGSILTLYSNRQGVRFKHACVMTHTTTKLVGYPSGGTVIRASTPGIQTLETKSRVPFSPTFTRVEGLDILGPSQLATLASLKVTKGKGSSTF